MDVEQSVKESNLDIVFTYWAVSILISVVPIARGYYLMCRHKHLKWIAALIPLLVVLGFLFISFSQRGPTPLLTLLGWVFILLVMPVTPPIVIICAALAAGFFGIDWRKAGNRNSFLLSLFALIGVATMTYACLKMGRLTFPPPDFSDM